MQIITYIHVYIYTHIYRYVYIYMMIISLYVYNSQGLWFGFRQFSTTLSWHWPGKHAGAWICGFLSDTQVRCPGDPLGVGQHQFGWILSVVWEYCWFTWLLFAILDSFFVWHLGFTSKSDLGQQRQSWVMASGILLPTAPLLWCHHGYISVHLGTSHWLHPNINARML